MSASRAEVERWAACGAMALTGRADGPGLGPPPGLVDKLDALGAAVGADALSLLAERAAIAGLTRQGDVSCGGGTRLLAASDDWVALSLTREDDVALVPALLERDDVDGPMWRVVSEAVRDMTAADLVARGRLLGLPVAALGERAVRGPVVTTMLGDAPGRAVRGARVVDLSALWAGPLCGALLADLGAEVTKVESARRPDGSRYGPPAFFDRMNGAKKSVVLDFDTSEGLAELRALLSRTDVVIEASRPRALEQLGIDAGALLAAGGPQVWVSITGHGRAAPGRDWVAFGDDAAVAGGLVVWDDEGPCFCADAIADPTSGLTAAAAAVDALAEGGRRLLDVSMAAVAASLGSGGVSR